jgi:8-oxo-dGTP diphosphatase
MDQPKKVGVGLGVLILKNRKILLGKRSEDPTKSDSELQLEGSWTMPGGKIEYGEGFKECAKRETMEETGIVLKSVKIICVNNDKNEHAHFVTVGAFSDDFLGEAKVMEPDEITEWKWFSLNDLPKNMYFPSKRLLECYLENKVNKY